MPGQSKIADMSQKLVQIGKQRPHEVNLWSRRAQDVAEELSVDISKYEPLKRQQGRYLQILKSQFPQMDFASKVIGGTFRFQASYQGRNVGTLSLPTGGFVFDKFTGDKTGMMHSVRTIDPETGSLSTYTQNLQEAIQGRSFGDARRAVRDLNKQTRFDVIKGGHLSGVGGLSRYQAVVPKGQEFAGLPGYGNLGTSSLDYAGMASVVKARTGLHLESTMADAMSRGVFSRYSPSDLSPFGGLGHIRHGQPHRVLPLGFAKKNRTMERVMSSPEAFGFKKGTIKPIARGLVFGGPTLETSFMKHLGENMPGAGRVSGRVRGLNIPTQYVMGADAMSLVTDTDQLLLSQQYADIFRKHTVTAAGRRVSVDVGTGMYGALAEKANIAGIFQGGTAGAFRTMGKASPRVMTQTLFGSYVLAAAESGVGTRGVARAVKQAIGPKHFTPDIEKAVLSTFDPSSDRFMDVGRLFEPPAGGSTASQAAMQISRTHAFLGRFGKALGIGDLGELEKRGYITRESGQITGIRTLQNIALRDMNMYPYKGTKYKTEEVIDGKTVKAIREMGMNPNRGLRVTEALISDVEAHGAPSLGRYLRSVQAQPEIRSAAGFFKQAAGIYEPIFDPGRAQRQISGVSAGSLRGRRFNRMYQTVESLVRGQEGDLSGVRKTIMEMGGLESLTGNKAGAVVDLGRARTVALDLGDTVASGQVSKIPLFNIAMGDDQYAYDVLRTITRGQDVDDQTVQRLVRTGAKLTAGGKDSPFHKLTSLRLGSTDWKLAQNPSIMTTHAKAKGLSPSPMKAFYQLVDQHMAGKPRDQVVEAGKRFNVGNWVFMDQNQFKRLSAGEKATYRKLGYLPVLSHRNPGIGKSAQAQRLIFADWLKGKNAFIESPGASAYAAGDIDFDWKSITRITLPGADDASQDLYKGFRELEREQAPLLKTQERLVMDRLRKGLVEKQKVTSTFVNTFGLKQSELTQLFEAAEAGTLGSPSGEVASILRKNGIKAGDVESFYKAAKAATTAGIGEKTIAQMSTKTMTGLLDPHIKSRRIMSGALRKLRPDFMTKGQWSIYNEFLPALAETAISKHGETDTLGMIKGINDSITAGGPDMRSSIRTKMKSLMEAAFQTYHKEKGLASMELYGREIFGPGFGGLKDVDSLEGLMKGPQFDEFLDRMTDVEIQLAETEKKLGPLLAGSPEKKAFTDQARAALRGGPLQGTPDAIDELAREYLAVRRPDIALGEAPAFKKGTMKAIAEAVAKEQAAKSGTTVTGKQAAASVKAAMGDLPGGAAQWFMQQVKKHPRIAGLTAIGAGVGASMWAYGKVSGGVVEHNAGQASPQRMAPRTNYVVNPMDEAGYNLSVEANLSPNDLNYASGMLNTLAGSSDMRVLDSRRGMSDRVLGYLAEDKMNSLYARSPI